MSRIWNSTVQCPGPTSAILTGSSAFSLVAWFKCEDNSAGSDFTGMYFEDGGFPTLFALQMKQSGAINAFYRDSGSNSNSITSAAGFDDGEWHWLYYVKRSSNDYQLYIDGSSEGTSATNAGTLTITSSDLKNANAAPSGSYLGSHYGFLSDIGIDEARAWAYFGIGPTSPEFSLLLGWTEASTTAAIVDQAGNGHDFTPGSALSFGAENPPTAMPINFGWDDEVTFPVAAASGSHALRAANTQIMG